MTTQMTRRALVEVYRDYCKAKTVASVAERWECEARQMLRDASTLRGIADMKAREEAGMPPDEPATYEPLTLSPDAAFAHMQRIINDAMVSVWAVMQPGYAYACRCCGTEQIVAGGLEDRPRVRSRAERHYDARTDTKFKRHEVRGTHFWLALDYLIHQGKVIDEFTAGVRLA